MSQATRVEATVTHIAESEFYVIALGDSGIDYFIPSRNFERMGALSFADVVYGTRVSLIPVEGPKGMRGVEVRILRIPSPPAAA